MNCVIGVDLGTTGCKAMVFSEDGCILGESYIEYPLILLSDTMIEQDADHWWELSKKAVYEALHKSGAKGENVRAIGISSQGLSFVPVDSHCRPLSNALSWLDTRAGEQADQILADVGENQIYKITGKRVNTVYVLPKLMWMKQKQPGIYRAAYKFLMAHDFLVAKLTGEYFTDHTMAGGTMLYDINSLSWSGEIIDQFNIDIHKLPDIKWSGEIAGTIKGDVALELGISKNALVCVGAQDQKAAALGVNLGHREAALSLGTAGAMEIPVSAPVFDESKSIPCFTYVQKGMWVLEAVISTAGACLKWCRNTLFPEMSYKEFDSLCAESVPGSNSTYFYPHFTGAASPFWDAKARGLYYGLSLSTERKDIARAVLEGIAFQVKSNIMKAKALGQEIDGIRVFGGGSKSIIWCGIISNITGKRVTAFSSPEIANLGAGMLAARGAGLCISGFGKAVLNNRIDIETDRDAVEEYRDIYEKYIRLERLFAGS